MQKWSGLAILPVLLVAGQPAANATVGEVVFGTAMAAAVGGTVGHEVGGREGAIVGGAVGGATGAAIAGNAGYRYGTAVTLGAYTPGPVYVGPRPEYVPRPVVVAPPPAVLAAPIYLAHPGGDYYRWNRRPTPHHDWEHD
jgi:hypothetical protein